MYVCMYYDVCMYDVCTVCTCMCVHLYVCVSVCVCVCVCMLCVRARARLVEHNLLQLIIKLIFKLG